ncbi:RrF2 family transcriptional regulator [Tunicatimonas pelagia]|uniref:RrF2 family transcriptional regulator n=1 Tax=Tunicatimonas pelagia TaxID=931531 RepID=UPI0026663244|nr:Rrf2 family transcriptional regulator [Tunicatimonas pelagia]WKN43038.1 Rrf2 family transcriptional regulator [Tunicatimonas pelagia]
MFSKACEYGIRATVYVAQQSRQSRRVSLKHIAREIDSPVAFTAKILQQLTKYEIIRSVMGVHGGFEMHEVQRSQIRLSQIVEAIDGPDIYRRCALGLPGCNALKPCPVHSKFVTIRNELKNMLESTYVSELADGVDTGLAFLKR